MYGKSRGSKGASSRRTNGITANNIARALKKVGGKYTSKKNSAPRFATVGFARNVEKKYFDKQYISASLEALTGITGNSASNGVTYISNVWGSYNFGAQVASTAISNDMCKGLDTGTTARTRIGNKLKVSYIKGAFTFTAAQSNGMNNTPQNGESQVVPLAANTKQDYLRTTYRFVIVKDLQVNSTDAQVTWAQVFDTTGSQAGVHAELNVDNMGRFIVIQDKYFTLDAQNPQQTCPFQVKGSSVGNVRYNGPGTAALTDKGIYVVWAAYVMGVDGVGTANVQCPSPVGHSRLCFTDD